MKAITAVLSLLIAALAFCLAVNDPQPILQSSMCTIGAAFSGLCWLTVRGVH
jgi:hypothetical protein